MALARRVLWSSVCALLVAISFSGPAASQRTAAQTLDDAQIAAEFVARCVEPISQGKAPILDGLFRHETVPHEVAVQMRESGLFVPSTWLSLDPRFSMNLGVGGEPSRCVLFNLPALPAAEMITALTGITFCGIASEQADWALVSEERTEDAFGTSIMGYTEGGRAWLSASWFLVEECSDA